MIVGVVLGVLGVVVILSIFALIYFRRRGRTPWNTGSRRDISENLETIPLTNVHSASGRNIPDADRVEGFVQTEATEIGLNHIKKNSYVLIIGKLGSSVSKTCKSITTKFVEEKSGWKSFHFNYKDILSPYNPTKKSIVFVDGWFGLWNDDPGELKNVQDSLAILLSKETQSICKIVVGIRSDIHDRYKSRLVNICPKFFNNVVNLDTLNRGRNTELEEHFHNKFNQERCNVQGCMCKNLKLEGIEDKDYNIGEFLKINILSMIHLLIPKWNASDLKSALIDHFDGLENTDKELYQCLMYVVLKGRHTEGADIDLELTESTNMSITKDSFDKRMNSLKKYLMILPYARLVYKTQLLDDTEEQEKKVFVFWHVFLYICAFHAIYRKHTEILLTHCNLDAIMQLVRLKEDDSPFTVNLKTESFDHLGMLLKERLKTQEKYSDHPFLKALENQK